MTRQCKRCDLEKPLTEFYKDKGFKCGYKSICKACKDALTMEWRALNRERYNESQRKQHKKHYTRNRLYRYKLDPEEYKRMFEAQGNKCAICDKGPTKKRALAIDHNHETGKVRGLLCYGCNRALSAFDNLELFNKIRAYLDKNNC